MQSFIFPWSSIFQRRFHHIIITPCDRFCNVFAIKFQYPIDWQLVLQNLYISFTKVFEMVANVFDRKHNKNRYSRLRQKETGSSRLKCCQNCLLTISAKGHGGYTISHYSVRLYSNRQILCPFITFFTLFVKDKANFNLLPVKSTFLAVWQRPRGKNTVIRYTICNVVVLLYGNKLNLPPYLTPLAAQRSQIVFIPQ